MSGWVSSLRRHVALPLAYRVVGDNRFARLDELLERDTWSAEQIRSHQALRLTALFRIARDHNPYWQDRFKTYGLRPNGSDPFAELAKLPVLTKDELRKHWRRMRSTHLPDSQVVQETSSGSTGAQVNVFQDKAYRELHAAMEYRSRRWMGVQPGDPYIAVQANGAYIPLKRRLLRRFRTAIERGVLIDGFELDPREAERLLLKASKRGTVHIHGYTTPLASVARLSQQLGLTWPALRAVSTTSEQLFDQDRELLAEAFGAPVYDRYGSREVLSVSMQCEHGSHHVYADVNHVEFLPLQEAEEETHAIVVTPLDNEAMPLFRYRGGDSASPILGDCPCGRQLPLMTGCRGRVCNNFVTPDGRLINGGYFLLHFYYQEGFKSFQFHQTTANHIDLYVVPDGELAPERRDYLDSVCRRIRQDHGGRFEVALHVVEEIPKRPGGKHLYTISDVLSHI
ncbi:MAG: phenylacetate--CoA ligase family protein [Phycisphaerae bacterium]